MERQIRANHRNPLPKIDNLIMKSHEGNSGCNELRQACIEHAPRPNIAHRCWVIKLVNQCAIFFLSLPLPFGDTH